MSRISRRKAFLSAAGAAAAPHMTMAAPAAETAPSASVYTKLGVTPFINCTATYTINGGAPMLPEVKRAMDEASNWAVNLDELMEKAGARVASLLGGESALISAGCAAALCHATAACIAGGDPEKMKRLPDSSGMRNEVLIARQSRNDYDHAYRTAGGRLVEFDTPEEFHAALGHRTAAVVVLGTGEAKGKLRLEQIAEAAHKIGVPVIVDAAAELPVKPNPYLSRGADVVAYSGGKILRGPQSAGVLLGRKDLIQAAWTNSAPHHGYGRAMKVSKEEIVGMVTALELFTTTRDLQAEYRTWESWYKMISDEITRIDGVSTRQIGPAGASPFPVMEVSWDSNKVGILGEEVYEKLLHGTPRIMSHAGGESTSFVIRAVAMRPEQAPLVAKRLAEVFRNAPKGPLPPGGASGSADLTGTWDVDLKFTRGSAKHSLTFDAPKGKPGLVRGLHVGQSARNRFKGTVKGSQVTVQSQLLLEGMHITYKFTGNVQGDMMSGELSLGEFGKGSFTAKRAS
ncbi:MAG: aminotransferase class V-fold PLP-dependent enzyme [Acidobacteria bacterium]|nr:aminotransferase class V-fold PLP-dependent enzyme [Acidobacteriota bacterium]